MRGGAASPHLSSGVWRARRRPGTAELAYRRGTQFALPLSRIASRREAGARAPAEGECRSELNKYAVVYTSYSRAGPGVSLALTEDFRSFERHGQILPPEDKDAALLPRRFEGRWALIHRPVGMHGAHIWITYSPDLRHWGSNQLILEARRGGWWDAMKVGLSPPPLETDRGWLVIYHGVRRTASGSIYRQGLALFDLESPGRCLRRGQSWVFGPEESYERLGDVANVVFPCGYTMDRDGDTLNLYYGAADSCMALARASVGELLDWLDRNGAEPYLGV